MRVVDVDPGEPLAGLALDPLERGGDHGIGPALALAGLAARRRVEPIVVAVEPGVQAESMIEREAADERAGRKPQAA